MSEGRVNFTESIVQIEMIDRLQMLTAGACFLGSKLTIKNSLTFN